MKHPIQLRQLRDYGGKINDSLLFLKQQFKGFIKMYLLMVAPFTLLASIFLYSFLHSVLGLVANNISNAYRINFGQIGWNLMLGIIFILLASVAVNVGVLVYIKAYEENSDHTPSLQQVWNLYKRHFFRLLAHVIGLVGMLIFFMFVCFLIALIPVIGPIMIFAAYLYIMIVLSLYFPVVILEQLSLSDGLVRCFELIKKNWWATFGFIITIFGVIYSFNWVLQISTSGIFTVFSIHSLHDKYSWLAPVYGFNYFIGSFLYVILIIGMALQYYNLSEKKDAFGLQQRIEMLGSDMEIQEPEQ